VYISLWRFCCSLLSCSANNITDVLIISKVFVMHQWVTICLFMRHCRTSLWTCHQPCSVQQLIGFTSDPSWPSVIRHDFSASHYVDGEFLSNAASILCASVMHFAKFIHRPRRSRCRFFIISVGIVLLFAVAFSHWTTLSFMLSRNIYCIGNFEFGE